VQSVVHPEDRRPPGRSGRLSLAEWAFLLLLLLLLGLDYRELIGFRPIAPILESNEGAFGGQLFVPNQKSPLLIFGLAVFFLATRLAPLRATLGQGRVGPGSLLLLTSGLALGAWSHYTGELPLGVVSLCLTLLGIAGVLGGREAVHLMRLPALILLLVVPIPGVLLNSLVHRLQLFTAQAVSFVLDVFQVENVVSGDTIYTATAAFQVIEGCSGLRAIETLVLTAVVYQALMPHSRLTSWILVLSAPLLGVLINLARVLSIVTDPEVAPNQDHTVQGIFMVVAGALMVAGWSYLLERSLPPSPALPGDGSDPLGDRVTRPASWVMRRGGLVTVLLALGLLATLGERWDVERPLHRNPTRLPAQFDGWQLEIEEIDEQFLGSTRYTQSILRSYRRGDERVRVFLGVDPRREPLLSGISPKSHVMGQGWRVVERRPADVIGPTEVHAVESVQRRLNRAALVISWQQGVEAYPIEAIRNALALDRSPWQRPFSATAVRISTPLRSSSLREQAAARDRLQPFVERVLEHFPPPDETAWRSGP